MSRHNFIFLFFVRDNICRQRIFLYIDNALFIKILVLFINKRRKYGRHMNLFANLSAENNHQNVKLNRRFYDKFVMFISGSLAHFPPMSFCIKILIYIYI